MQENNNPIDLSKVKLHPRKYGNGVRIACTWRFNDGTEKGTSIRMDGYGETELLAKDKLLNNIIQKQEEFSLGNNLKSGNTTVKKAVEIFLQQEKEGKYISRKTGKPKTPIAVEHDFETARALLFPCKGFMALQLSKVLPASVDGWVDWVEMQRYTKGDKKYPYSSDKKNKAFELLKKAFAPYYRRRTSPLDGVEKWVIHSKKKTEDDILIPDEIKSFITYCLSDLNDHSKAQGLIHILTYVRTGELLGLKVGDYDREKGTLRIQRKLIRHTDGSLELSCDGYAKTDSSLRTIALEPFTCAILNRLTEGRNKDEMLFLTSKGNMVNSRNYTTWFHNTLKTLNIDKNIPVYRLRASGITFAICCGADVHGVMLNAGHSDVKTTLQFYTAPYKEMAKKAAFTTGEGLKELMAIEMVAIEEKKE